MACLESSSVHNSTVVLRTRHLSISTELKKFLFVEYLPRIYRKGVEVHFVGVCLEFVAEVFERFLFLFEVDCIERAEGDYLGPLYPAGRLIH